MRSKFFSAIATFATLAALAGCETGSDNPVPMTGRALRIVANGFPNLKNGMLYEGWAILGGTPITTGKFNVNAAGKMINAVGTVIPNGEFSLGTDISAATALVITIEPAVDPDPGPTDTHFLAGNITAGTATLTAGGAQALGNNFATAMGKFVLATPTNGMNTNEKSGVWFLDLSSGAPAQGLNLPTLPAGWQYEGWTIVGGVPLTTGKFTNINAADLSAPFSGAMAGPPFPGEDYLMNAPAGLTFPLDLSGAKVAITIEPSPDDSPGPFLFKPLSGDIPAGAMDNVTFAMTNDSATMPTAMGTIR